MRERTAIADRRDILPTSCPPRGLSRDEAARYIGVSVTLFDQMVRDRRMPVPKKINARLVWDRIRLDAAFDAIADENGEADDVNPWDEVL